MPPFEEKKLEIVEEIKKLQSNKETIENVNPEDVQFIRSIDTDMFTDPDREQETFDTIREIGQEYGATTGRPRQINWLDFDMLKMATRINGCTKVVFNKMDVLEGLNSWCLYDGPNLYQFEEKVDIETWLSGKLELEVSEDIEVMFSGDKERI